MGCPRQKQEAIVMTHFKDEYGILGLSATPKLNQFSFTFPHFFTDPLKFLLAKDFLNNHDVEDIKEKIKSLD